MQKTLYLLLLTLLVGCTAPIAKPPAPVPSAGGGTILSMRDVNVPTDGSLWRAAMLADSGGIDRSPRNLVEFIVRADDGATLSIVQANELGLHTGDRVIILHDAQTRLARPG